MTTTTGNNTTVRDQRNEDRAMRLAEATAIVTARPRPSAQTVLHLCGPSGSTICSVPPSEWTGVFKNARVIRSEDRVCRACIRGSERAYGERLTAAQVLADYNAFMANDA